MTRSEYEQANLAGQSARAAGRHRDDGPRYALGAEGTMLREAWLAGYDDKDAEIKASRKSK